MNRQGVNRIFDAECQLNWGILAVLISMRDNTFSGFACSSYQIQQGHYYDVDLRASLNAFHPSLLITITTINLWGNRLCKSFKTVKGNIDSRKTSTENWHKHENLEKWRKYEFSKNRHQTAQMSECYWSSSQHNSPYEKNLAQCPKKSSIMGYFPKKTPRIFLLDCIWF